MTRTRIATAVLSALLSPFVPLGAAEDHAGHDHAAGHGHAHGAAQAVGSVEIGAYTVAVSAAGSMAAGAESHIELSLSPEQPAPKAIRVWIGAENGRGSVKSRADSDGKLFSAHVVAPNPIPADGKLWITIEAVSGQVAKGSLSLPKAEAAHHDGDGHQH